MILKVLVGSRAHGLAREDSDYDYRGVFVHPTSRILSLGPKPEDTSWIEKGHLVGMYLDAPQGQDDTAWEVGKFLALATQCNPTILEVFAAPIVEASVEWGPRLRDLLHAVWDPRRVRDAFVGYGLNQRKKFLDAKDGRPVKYACAYLRTLYQAHTLLSQGHLPVDMTGTLVFDTLVRWRQGAWSIGAVIDYCHTWETAVETALVGCAHRPDLEAVNGFLLELRRAYW